MNKSQLDSLLIGIDEAGRGPFAGPVYAGLVIINQEIANKFTVIGITDSKKINKSKRTLFYEIIKKESLYSKVINADVDLIDRIGIYKATLSLIEELIKDSQKYLEALINKSKFTTKITVDGIFPTLKFIFPEIRFLPKADANFIEVGSASILAKVERDFYMTELDKEYPQYQFSKHKGYGTKLHIEMLKKFGVSPHHRKSFKPIKALLQ